MKAREETLQSVRNFIDANVTGWEVVTCNVCGRNADYECATPCPVATAVEFRRALQQNAAVAVG